MGGPQRWDSRPRCANVERPGEESAPGWNSGGHRSVRSGADRSSSGWSGVAISRFHIFPYREEEEILDPQGASSFAVRPTVQVVLERSDASWVTKALIDTGSNLSLFDRGSGEALGVDFTDAGAPRRSVDIVGRRWGVVGSYVTLSLPPFEDVSWDSLVWFFLDDWDMPFSVLGNEGFLDRWAVTFNRYFDYFVIEPADDFHQHLPVDPFVEFQRLDHDWQRPTLD